MMTAEHKRLADSEARLADWKEWGPYVSERAWGTVREDYSENGDAWASFPHDHARSRVYRWNEDGLAGFCNRYQNLVLAIALWNERDPILKERLYGLTGPQGNNGEDVKEFYSYLDSTPTHSYASMLYRYPQSEFPYESLLVENARRRQGDPEYELIDALREDFHAGRYFDVFVEYAKADEDDILCRITAVNCGPDPAPIHILPHFWYRNDWSWGYGRERPVIATIDEQRSDRLSVHTEHRHLGERWWYVDTQKDPEANLLFTENETNFHRLYGQPNKSDYVKDGIHDAVIAGDISKVNPAGTGSKVAAHFRKELAPGESWSVRVRFTCRPATDPFGDFDAVMQKRLDEADEFYEAIHRPGLSEDERKIQREAFGGLLWTKQLYHYSVELWMDGDPAGPQPPESRRSLRNAAWRHLYNLDVISMPDKWEYPWYAAWDLAFHTLPLALIDPEWAKRQHILMLREWYMHPNGQIPAYEWNFGDVNPPVQAWAALRVYEITRRVTGNADVDFLEKVFHKLLLNFTWWVNRKDVDGRNVFQGGFLGLDNIGVFDRSKPLPVAGHLEQADGTAWMAMYSLNMLSIALELARHRPAYEDVASKFFEHFVYIAGAINETHDNGGLWDEADGFYYNAIHADTGPLLPIKLRSFVGLTPLYAVETLDPDLFDALPDFARRMDWFVRYRPDWVQHMALFTRPGEGGRRLFSLVDETQLKRVLSRMLNETEFLSEYGLRSLSREYLENPFEFTLSGLYHQVKYEPGVSSSGMFGGNSNWRGPIWFPVNYLMIEALHKYHRYYGESLQVELPTGSGRYVTLDEAANELSRRLIKLFLLDDSGRRAYLGDDSLFQEDRNWRDRLLFYEFFHGDSGVGLGASHQTGWTALVANLIQQCGGTM